MSNDKPSADSVPTKVNLPRRRRWLQLSLRGLLALMFVAACACGWIAYKVREIRQQDQAIKALRTDGCLVYASQSPDSRMTDDFLWNGFEHFFAPNPDDSTRSWLGWIADCDDAEVVAVAIDSNGNVRRVLMYQPVPVIGPKEAKVATERTLKTLENVPNVRGLLLIGTGIDDAALEHLHSLPKLRHLALWDTSVSDAGLEQIAKLSELQSIQVVTSSYPPTNQAWTKAGVERLRQSLPQTRIQADGPDFAEN